MYFGIRALSADAWQFIKMGEVVNLSDVVNGGAHWAHVLDNMCSGLLCIEPLDASLTVLQPSLSSVPSVFPTPTMAHPAKSYTGPLASVLFDNLWNTNVGAPVFCVSCTVTD